MHDLRHIPAAPLVVRPAGEEEEGGSSDVVDGSMFAWISTGC
jgi:hypothetical protein